MMALKRRWNFTKWSQSG